MTLKEFFYIDWKDRWNWILLILAMLLFWWGINGIVSAIKAAVP